MQSNARAGTTGSLCLALAAAFTFSTMALAGPTPEQKCEAGTNAAAGKHAACLAKAEKGFVTSGDVMKYDAAVAKCDAKITRTWTKLEAAAIAKGGTCPATGDLPPIGALVAACTDSVAAGLGGDVLDSDPATCRDDINNCYGEVSSCQMDVQVCYIVVPHFGLLQSGQKVCWDAAGAVIPCATTGYDGEIQAGAEFSYTDNADGTITDRRTGLEWEVLTDDSSIHDWNNIYTWSDAFTKVNDLNTAAFAGHFDWRLPNARELQTLPDFDRASPAIDPVFHAACVPGCSAPACSCTTNGTYWTSTSSRPSTSTAWYVSFGLGVTLASNKASTAAVRAVRGGY
ncbi:MAG: DUF1566 domain-containing protein [Candidatus Binatia bacterium]